jgi:lipopolysaccharide transport system ATP-binding protein
MLEHGMVKAVGPIAEVVRAYLSNARAEDVVLADIQKRKGNGKLRFTHGYVGGDGSGTIETFKSLTLKLDFILDPTVLVSQRRIDIGINNFMGDRIAWLSTSNILETFNIANNQITFTIEHLPLAPGDYSCTIYSEINNEVTDWLIEVLPFTVAEKDYYGSGKLVPRNQGNILLNYKAE